MRVTCTCTTDWGYVSHLAGVINAAVSENEKLSNIEMDCFCAIVLTIKEFGTAVSTSAKERIKELVAEHGKFKDGRARGKFSDNGLSRYRASLVDKGWLIADGNYYLPKMPYFQFHKTSLATPREVNVVVKRAYVDAET